MAIKVSDLRPCDNCGGPIAPMFYVIRTSLAMIQADAVNEFMGMHQFFGGRAGTALVENFAPKSVDAVLIAGDKDPALMTELFICRDCYLEKALDLAILAEQRESHTERRTPMSDPNDTTTDQPETPAPETTETTPETPADEQPTT